jgi:transcription elongation factor GreA
MKKKYYLTKEGFDNLQSEYARLKNEEWPAILKRVSEARESGNLEDDPEFEEANRAKEIIEGRILEIEQIIENVEIIEAAFKGIKGKISLGTTVTLEVQGENQTFTIVGSIEADPTQGRLSHESPLGKQLLGLKEGDIVEIKLPFGNVEYRVVKIH